MKHFYNVSVSHGGERLYVTPVVIPKNPRESTVQFYHASEFTPMNLQDHNQWVYHFRKHHWGDLPVFIKKHYKNRVVRVIGTLITGLRNMHTFYSPVVQEFVNNVVRSVKQNWRRPRNILWVIRLCEQLTYGVLCKKVYHDLRVSVDGQLILHDPDGIVEENYLTPSQKILQVWYEDRVDINRNSEYDSEREAAESYLKLKASLSTDEELFFIAELDT